MSNLYGARKIGAADMGALTINGSLDTIFGVAVTLITPPTDAEIVVLLSQKNTFRARIGDYVSRTLTPANATNSFAAAAHGFTTGQGPYLIEAVTTLPTGIVGTTDYYIIATDAGNIQLALTKALAEDGTAVTFSDDGTGAITTGTGFPAAVDIAAGPGAGHGTIRIPEDKGLIIAAPSLVTVKGYDAAAELVHYSY